MEELLIVLLAVASGLSLFAGLAQALDGRPRRTRLRRAHALSPHHRRAAAESRPPLSPARGARIFSEAAPASASRVDEVDEPVRPAGSEAPLGDDPAAAAPLARVEPEQISLLDAPEPAAMPAALAMEPVAPEPPLTEPVAVASGAPDLVAEAARMLRAGEHEALLAALDSVLRVRGRGKNRPPASYERALLWGMAGLANRARGDEAATRAAFEQGLRALPKSDVNGSETRVMPLAESVGSQLLAGGEAAGDGTPSTLAALRLAVGLLRGVAIVQGSQSGPGPAPAPGDAAVGGDDLPPWGKALRAHLAVERARDALATAAERRLGGFLDKRDHAGGHRWLREAMAWDELGDRRAPVEDVYWQSVGREITRLTGSALASADDLAGATAALQSAEALVAALPPETTASPRMDEIRRRIWWGHTKLGLQRLEAGDPAGGMEPLYRALHLAAGDPDREAETRHALAEALDTQAAGASEHIESLLRSGDRIGAETAGQELCRVIDRGLAEGVSQEELMGALAKRQDVMARIAQADGP